MFEIHNCERCNGGGYIPEYSHVQDGICFSCWGTGSRIFNSSYPELNELLKTQIKLSICSSKKNEIIKEIGTLCQLYNNYNSQLKVAEAEEDQDGIRFYDIEMNKTITKLYSLSKHLRESGVLIENR